MLDAYLFDLDGVVTKTVNLHARAWKRLFDDYLAARAVRRGEPFIPFDDDADYRRDVDGKPRYDGVRSFLETRRIRLPWGAPADGPGAETVCGLGNRKDRYFNELLREHGPEVIESTVAFVRELRSRGLRTAVVSASRNARAVLEAAGLSALFDVCIDGVETERLGLRGKPAPDGFLEAAHRLGVEPPHAAVVEDAVSGIRAARSGGFGLVVGIDPTGRRARELDEAGAHIVVADVREVAWRTRRRAG